MRHDAITKCLDAEADLHKAEALLDDLEPSSGARFALEFKVAELRLAAIQLAIQEDATVEPALAPPLPTQEWNGRGVFWGPGSICACLVLAGALLFAVRHL